eukprot:GEZU01018380.1.p1 GENE.GEZU01018380.1~~GEZU01018380.1.p1  ORF type:complete len:410 (-),score=122.72 GEZU01018380.1:68-1297(-)
MGIKGLTKLIGDKSPSTIKEDEIKNYFGRKIAIDASMSMYQFMIAVKGGQGGQDLTNEAGEVTSHLSGMFFRTIRMLELGIKPIYVFDGKPPQLKSSTLQERSEKAADARAELEKAQEEENEEAITKFSKRTVRVSREQSEECKKLLKLMGVPVITAPSEAEAQCAALCKAGKVYATGTEDMDALTFGTPILVRHLTFSEARKQPIQEFNLKEVLEGLELDYDQFVDLCILCGCDYCDTIRGIGPLTALKLIKQHKNIEGVLQNIDTKKYTVPENFPYEEVRKLFKEPEVITEGPEIDFKWRDPDEEGLIQFLCNEKQFQEKRVRAGIEKIRATRKKATQDRLTSFFGPVTKVTTTTNLTKRKREEEEAAKAKGGKGKAGVAGKAKAGAKTPKASSASSSGTKKPRMKK